MFFARNACIFRHSILANNPIVWSSLVRGLQMVPETASPSLAPSTQTLEPSNALANSPSPRHSPPQSHSPAFYDAPAPPTHRIVILYQWRGPLVACSSKSSATFFAAAPAPAPTPCHRNARQPHPTRTIKQPCLRQRRRPKRVRRRRPRRGRIRGMMAIARSRSRR
ncbi:hypothetical protein BU26DRAFT_252907 [Trematosphaeria pertusa]|uniref:Uncharacterized protein n=1 Tax=Trematosphaeria pertusa TaxID=390896 RepID=A0A6A6IPM0_9PLEO|nr:uncharacterized protein BU26DRAFT_252907 [Trematosphaeria pertusa]KAF2252209.1 hypothetical protein BU26DRAFT_252907 [Trematosphaeria pertusa]